MYRAVIQNVPSEPWEGFNAIGKAWDAYRAGKCRGGHVCHCCYMESKDKAGHWKRMDSNH